MSEATAVAAVRVDEIHPAESWDAERAKAQGAPKWAPEIPQQRIVLTIEEAYYGLEDAKTIDVIYALAPTGMSLPEDPPFRVGTRELLFLTPSEAYPGTWQVVGLDGRIPLDDQVARAEGLLPNGPAKEINSSLGTLHETLRGIAG